MQFCAILQVKNSEEEFVLNWTQDHFFHAMLKHGCPLLPCLALTIANRSQAWFLPALKQRSDLLTLFLISCKIFAIVTFHNDRVGVEEASFNWSFLLYWINILISKLMCFLFTFGRGSDLIASKKKCNLVLLIKQKISIKMCILSKRLEHPTS